MPENDSNLVNSKKLLTVIEKPMSQGDTSRVPSLTIES